MCIRTPVCDLAGAGVDGLEELVHLIVTHLLAQIGENVAQLADTDKSGAILVKHLEAAAIFVDVAGVAEAAGAVQDLGEGLEIDYLPTQNELSAVFDQRGRFRS